MSARWPYTNRPGSLYESIRYPNSMNDEVGPSDSTSDVGHRSQHSDWPLPRDPKSQSRPKSLSRNNDLDPEPNVRASAHRRMLTDSPILATIFTNIKDEYTFITELSYILSSLYQRPESSIFCTLRHSSLLIYDGSFAPAYTLSISTHPLLCLPRINERCAAKLAKGIQDVLCVPPDRGIIRFLPVPETCYAVAGKTLGAVVEELELEIEIEAVRDAEVDRRQSTSPGRQGKVDVVPKARKRHSVSALRNLSLLRPRAGESVFSRKTAEKPLFVCKEDDMEKSDEGEGDVVGFGSAVGEDVEGEKERKVRARKSFVSLLFGRTGVAS